MSRLAKDDDTSHTTDPDIPLRDARTYSVLICWRAYWWIEPYGKSILTVELGLCFVSRLAKDDDTGHTTDPDIPLRDARTDSVLIC